MHLHKKIILLSFLFGYSVMNFGSGVPETLNLPNLKLCNRTVKIGSYLKEFPKISNELIKIKFIVNAGYFNLAAKCTDIDKSPFTIETNTQLTLSDIGSILTKLKNSPFTTLDLDHEQDDQLLHHYNINHTSVLSAALKYNTFLDTLAYSNIGTNKITKIDLTDIENTTLNNHATSKASKNKKKKFLLLIPIIGGTAVIGLVGPAMLLANLTALGASLIAVTASFGIVILSTKTPIAKTALGAVLPFALPIVILKDRFFK